MGRIDTLQVHNFKFFDKQEPLKIGGKHLLLYGENGSGKSSIYWSLYTLFEAAVKTDTDEIEKYFKHSDDHNESLINIHSEEIIEADGTKHFDSFIKVVTDNDQEKDYHVSLLDTSISGDPVATEINLASDFINYKMLFKFQDFWNGQSIDLANIFEGYILPYVRFAESQIWRSNTLHPKTNAFDMLQEIKTGPGSTLNVRGNVIQVYKYSKENKQFNVFASHFDVQFNDLIDFINAYAPTVLKELGYDIDFNLKYTPHTHRKADSKYYYTPFKIELKITSYLGKRMDIHRPQSFLNEAKITAIALAIRLSILKKRVNEQAPNVLKFIVFDDVMISLDMNNRDKLMDYLLNPKNKYTEDYQLLFLTHDKNLFDFIANKIKKWDNKENWVLKEMYTGKNIALNKEYPIIIDSQLDIIDKARKYYDAKDYTACSIYLRKELERIVTERLPIELKTKVSEKYIALETLWDRMIERYSVLNIQVSNDIKDAFKESKLHILNPQAHYQSISLPVYRNELDKIFKLIDDIQINYPVPTKTLLINKETLLTFSYLTTTHNYVIKFELLTDFYIDELNGTLKIHYPKCKVVNWSYNGIDFWDFHLNQPIVLAKPMEFNKLQHLISLVERQSLGITNSDFVKMTKIDNGIWSLKDVIDKVGISI